jgi:RNA polymerase primary sigma factor
MNSESAFRANGASLADSVKKFSLEDPEDQAELDLCEQLSLELNSACDGAASDVEEREASADNEPLTIYLKEIRSVQLLTRQQEIEIAKRREAGESQVVESILSTPVASQYVLSLADKVQNDEIRLSDVIEGLTREDDTAVAPVESQFNRRDAFLKSVISIKRRLGNVEALQRKAHAKETSQRARPLLQRTITKNKQQILGMLRDLGLTRLQLTVIGESLRQ